MSIHDFEGSRHLEIRLTFVLGDYSGRPDQTNEWSGASVHYRRFARVDVDIHVIDVQTGERCNTCSIVLTWNPLPLIAVQSSVGTDV